LKCDATSTYGKVLPLAENVQLLKHYATRTYGKVLPPLKGGARGGSSTGDATPNRLSPPKRTFS
jgi:hypothetical protein